MAAIHRITNKPAPRDRLASLTKKRNGLLLNDQALRGAVHAVKELHEVQSVVQVERKEGSCLEVCIVSLTTLPSRLKMRTVA